VFVQNRIIEIRKEQDLVFAYLSSSQNPADFATRGLIVAEITDCSLWWHGYSYRRKIGLSGIYQVLHLRD